MANVTRRILIVEDNPVLAQAIADLVQSMGYEVVGPLHNLDDALDHAKVHFALLDFDLGNGTDATPVAKTLAERGVPFAFTTATEVSVIRKVFERAIVIPKPVAPADLARVLPRDTQRASPP